MATVLFAQLRPTPPFFFGGAEVNVHVLAEQLRDGGQRVVHLGSYTHPRWRDDRRLAEFVDALGDTVTVDRAVGGPRLHYQAGWGDSWMVAAAAFPAELHRLLADERPDLVVTTCERSGDVCAAVAAAGSQSLCWVQDATDDGRQSCAAPATLTGYASGFLRRYWADRGGRPGPVLYPPFRRPVTPPADRPVADRVLMVNPIREKGVALFLRLAAARPDLSFRAVQGWRDPDWDPQRLPGNVTFGRRRSDLAAEFAAASVLLVPSAWLEGFGRVAVEAGLHGRPALCRVRGGLPEACGVSELLVDGARVADWSAALDRVLTGGRWPELTSRAAGHARRFLRPVPAELRAFGLAC